MSDALTVGGNGELKLGKFTLSTTGAKVDGEPSYEEWEQVYGFAKRAESGVLWWLGDLLNYGEGKFGEQFSQVMDATGLQYSYWTIAHAKYVSSRIEFCRRRQNLSFPFHQEVAHLPSAKQDRLLSDAEAGGWSFRQLRQAVREERLAEPSTPVTGCTVADLHSLVSDGKRFGCIYADPPWQYGNQSTRAATDNHYQTMTLDEICALPVRDLAADQSHLHLWTTNGFLPDAFRVIEAWGFEYKSVYVWCKRQMGIGNYWRVSHEFLLLGVRGGLTFDAKDLMSWGVYDRTQHSAKPPEIRAFLERASPDPRLELFGRRTVKGWTIWGNEITTEEFRQEVIA